MSLESYSFRRQVLPSLEAPYITLAMIKKGRYNPEQIR